jgi:uncharacterized protein YyaL (SSP411 family)
MPTIRTALSSSISDIAVSFISASSLKRWCEFVFMSTTRKANWEDFRRFAEKYLIWLRQEPCEEQEAFFSSYDARREEVLKMVPRWQIEAFREQSVVDSVKTAREYLG